MNQLFKKSLFSSKGCRVFMLFCLVIFGCPRMVAASEFPVIGEPMPYFALNKIIDYSKTTIDSKSLTGKWYILDFWIMGCQPCIKSFPRVSDMVQQFKDKVEIFSVGIGGPELERFYEPIRKKEQLKIPMAFDILLASKWQVHSYPFIFIVDDKGILRAITYETNAAKLNTLMESGQNDFVKVENYKQYLPNDVSRLYFVNGNGGNDSTFLFRSVIAKATDDYSSSGIANLNQEGPGYDNLKFVSATNLEKGLFQMSKTSLLTLYNTAFFGQDRAWITDSIYKEAVLLPAYQNKILWPVLRVKDSSNFRVNYKTSEGLFTYSLSVPRDRANKNVVMKAMQADLWRCFGYEAKIETHSWPVWRIVVADHRKVGALKTKGADAKTSVYTNTMNHLINASTSQLAMVIFGEHQFDIILDESGLNYKIDIKLEGPIADMDVVKKQLNANGFDIIRGEKEMKVLIISDPVL